MLISPSIRRVCSTGSIVFGVSLLVCLLKYALVTLFGSDSVPVPVDQAMRVRMDVPVDEAMRVRMDVAQLTPIRISDKKGEFVISVNAGDLDDLVSLPPRKMAAPEVAQIILHDPFLCERTNDLKFIIYVHSSPTNVERRRLLRLTYANPRLFKTFTFRVIFLLGLPKQNGVQQEIKREFEVHGDIVQGHFVDDYRNMTLKAVMGLNWIQGHCPQAAFAIKVDDDTFFNIFELLPVLEKNADHPLLLVCPLWKEGTMRILRERKTCMKWCVTKREIPGDFYPQYCAGISYMLSMELIQRLTATALSTPFFWIDDVYVTGLLPRKIKERVHYADVMVHFTVDERLALAQYANASQPISIYLVHMKRQENFLPLWKLLIGRLTLEQRRMLNEKELIAVL